MKTERRHELQTNDLADMVGNYIEENQGFLKVAIGGVVGLLAVWIGYAYLTQQQELRLGSRWNDYFNTLTFTDTRLVQDDELAKNLHDVADKHQGTLPGLWALQSEASLDLESGARQLFSERKTALDELEQAKKNFERVIKEGQRFPLLMQQARLGLAQSQECLGEIAAARKTYEELARSAGDSALGKLAANRAKMLADPTTEQFYSWFEKQTPRPAMSRSPDQNTSGLPPLDFGSLPKAPILSTDDSEDKQPEAKPDDAKSSEAKPAAESEAKQPEAKKADEAKSPEPKQPEPKQPESKQPESKPAPEAEKKSDEATKK